MIKVKEDELVWESSIEKVLHNFSLRLIVPSKYYSQVNQYVNNNNLRGRIRYDKYEAQDYLKNFQSKHINEKSLVNKIEIKTNISYYEWIENNLEAQFNFICVQSLSEFEQHSEMAITQNGLIKFKRGKHEKDDRPHISKKENYVLGWDNKEKIRVLSVELKKQQELQAENKKTIINKNTEIKKFGIFRDECHNLFTKFDKYDDVHWQAYASQIQNKTVEKEALETTNDRVKQLQSQLSNVQKELKQLSEVDILDKNRAIFQTEAERGKLVAEITINKSISEPLGYIDVSAFEKQQAELLTIEYSNLELFRKKFQDENSKQTRELDKQKSHNESDVRIRINSFKQPTESITNKFKDWRSDVGSLPDSTNLEFISDYQHFLDRLEKDNLPKFEKKFNEYLQETITNKVGDFRMFFQNWSDSIKENIKQLNDSLK